MEYLSGLVERITFVNEENGFSVIKIKSKGIGELITVVGNMTSVTIGSVLVLFGEWKHDNKFGRQFKVVSYEEKIPATVKGIEKYLGSGLIKGVGPLFASRIVNKFKENTIKIIEDEPHRLIEVEGIGAKRVEIIKEAWEQQKEIKNIMLFLQTHEISTVHAIKIYKEYGNNSIKIVEENPYKLADDIWGIGFRTADKIAQKLGFKKDSHMRCRSGLIYLLNEFSSSGHCYATYFELIEEAEKILEIKKETIESTLQDIIEEKQIIKDFQNCLYLPVFYHSEIGIAKRIKSILEEKSDFADIDIESILTKVQVDSGLIYDDIQVEAIKCAVSSKFMVLTGGPGTGKTTTIQAIIRVFKEAGLNVLLAAPTGRAAKRMSEISKTEAKTIHRLLEYKPSEGYMKHPQNPIECDVLIIDETSMIDIILMYNLLKAIRNSTIVLLVGDVDQLPSVGPGNILKDIIDSDIVKVVRLNRVFRQAKESMIIMNAHKINKGEFPELKGDKNSDFFFIKEENTQKIVEQIKELCIKRLPKYYGINPINDIQILCPMQKGEIGTINLNEALQEALNPSKIEIKYAGINYKIGDKIMQIKNNYDKNIFNGDIGIIKYIDTEDKTLFINFDGIDIEYDITEMDEVTLAYATTIHKSQGSEYKIVIAPFSMSHYMMLQKNLLYTCVTRAKKVLIIIGSKKAISIAINNNKELNRNTTLKYRLNDQISFDI